MARIKKPARSALHRDTGGDKKNTTEEKIDKAPADENVGEFFSKSKEVVADGKEALSQEQVNELRKKIETMDLGDDVRQRAKTQSHQIESLKEEEKIKNLLKITKEKGVVYAVTVAKNMNDPYILDTFHDRLIEEGYYNEFLK